MVALAIIQLVVSGKPGGNFFEGKSIDFGTPYYTITIVLNVVVTILICTRLIRLYSSLSQIAENSHLLKFFTRLTSVLIESAALYSLVGITFLILYASGSEISIAFGQVWAKLTVSCNVIIPEYSLTGTILTVYMSTPDYSQDGQRLCVGQEKSNGC
jgi:hypothetical protein